MLSFASVSKRVLVRNHSYENKFRVQVHFQANQTHFRQQAISSQFFSIFELGGITKHLMTCPAGNSEFCLPRLQRSLRLYLGEHGESRETKLTISQGASHQVLFGK